MEKLKGITVSPVLIGTLVGVLVVLDCLALVFLNSLPEWQDMLRWDPAEVRSQDEGGLPARLDPPGARITRDDGIPRTYGEDAGPLLEDTSDER